MIANGRKRWQNVVKGKLWGTEWTFQQCSSRRLNAAADDDDGDGGGDGGGGAVMALEILPAVVVL